MIQSGWLYIGDVARMLGEPEHVLRFWQSEFGYALGLGSVPRSRGKRRCYPPDTVATLREVQRLLRVELYTIAGAKRQLRLAADRVKAAG